MKYFLMHLGCQMNQSDAERIRTVLEGMGMERTEREEEAGVLGMVACSVRQKAIDRVYSRIHKWNTLKRSRSILTLLSGCVLPADREKFLDRFDIVFAITELPELPEMIRSYGVVTPASARGVIPPESTEDERRGYWHVEPDYSPGVEAFIAIQNGCDKFCTFCAVPYARGREVSRPADEILREFDRVVERGYGAITLLGQNVNSYGRDRTAEGVDFPELLRRVGRRARTSGRDFWVYFTSPHPRDMTRELLEVIAEYPHLARQIHLPLQSGDDTVLANMNRKHTLADYRRIVGDIRDVLPEATLFTDIIVGFPGETGTQFERTRRAMQEFRYNMAYVAMYSPRPGAKSTRWQDDVPHDEKKRRLHVLSEELKASVDAQNQELIGRRFTVLVSGHDRKPGHLTGMTEGRRIVRFPSTETHLIGRFVEVEITGHGSLSLSGELVDAPQAAARVGN
jgi:tRNA-2-methylthio-N6-dimethylallyladenosine synthase